MNQEYFDYIFSNRLSGFYHPTREKIFKLFYEIQQSQKIPCNDINCCFSYLDGEPGLLSDDEPTNLRYIMLNCCFYFCEFLISNHVDSELVYNSSDYFINQVSNIKTKKQASKILNDIAQATHDLLKNSKQGSYGIVVEKSIHYINQHLYSGVNLNEVAEFIGLTPQYLTTLFKHETSKTLYEYIQDKKVDEAKMLLIQTNKSITIIANALGFNSTAHFSNTFKLKTGFTPSYFRNKMIK